MIDNVNAIECDQVYGLDVMYAPAKSDKSGNWTDFIGRQSESREPDEHAGGCIIDLIWAKTSSGGVMYQDTSNSGVNI